jgi:hypothetical protein
MGYVASRTTTHGAAASRVDDPTIQGSAYVVVNAGATTVYIGTSSAVTTGSGHAVAAGQGYPIVPTGTVYPQVWAITASGTATLTHHYVR